MAQGTPSLNAARLKAVQNRRPTTGPKTPRAGQSGARRAPGSAPSARQAPPFGQRAGAALDRINQANRFQGDSKNKKRAETALKIARAAATGERDKQASYAKQAVSEAAARGGEAIGGLIGAAAAGGGAAPGKAIGKRVGRVLGENPWLIGVIIALQVLQWMLPFIILGITLLIFVILISLLYSSYCDGAVAGSVCSHIASWMGLPL